MEGERAIEHDLSKDEKVDLMVEQALASADSRVAHHEIHDAIEILKDAMAKATSAGREDLRDKVNFRQLKLMNDLF